MRVCPKLGRVCLDSGYPQLSPKASLHGVDVWLSFAGHALGAERYR